MYDRKTLTKEQQAAVESTHPRIGVIAGAGTGKTHVLAARVNYMVANGVDPRSILMLTFTNRAARQLRDAILDSRVKVGTFHSVAHSFNSGYSVMSIEQAEDVCKKINVSFSHGDYQKQAAYEQWMRANQQTDFGFLLTLLRESVSRGDLDHFKHILIDEAQDTDDDQWEIVDAIIAKGATLFAVGDPKQQIYEWRGADSQLFLDRVEEIHVLHQSWRFGKDIAEVHNRLCKDVDQYLEGNANVNSRVWIGTGSVANQVGYLIGDMFGNRDIAVLCRTNQQVKKVKDELRKLQIPVEESNSLDCAELDFLKYLCNPACRTKRSDEFLDGFPDDHPLAGVNKHLVPVAKTWIDNWLSQSFVEATVGAVLSVTFYSPEAVKRICELVGDMPLREGVAELVLGSSEIQESRTGVTVCTVHQAKGLQFPAVVAVSAGVKETDEESRVALVQATRAQEQLRVVDNAPTQGPLARATWSVNVERLMEDTGDVCSRS